MSRPDCIGAYDPSKTLCFTCKFILECKRRQNGVTNIERYHRRRGYE